MPDRLKTLDRTEVLARLGTEPVADAQVDAAIAAMCGHVRPNAIYRYFNLETAEDGVRLKGTSLTLRGEAVARLLENCQSCAVLVVTIGSEAEQAVHDAETDEVPLLHACAATAAAFLQRQLQGQVRNEALRQRMYATTSICPGQEDLPPLYRGMLADLLDTRDRMGVTVGEDNTFSPSYSWIAVVGLSNRDGHCAADCETCVLRARCSFLANKITCATV